MINPLEGFGHVDGCVKGANTFARNRISICLEYPAPIHAALANKPS